MLGVGLFWRYWTGDARSAPIGAALKVDPASARHAGALSPITGFALLYLLLRGFAEGAPR